MSNLLESKVHESYAYIPLKCSKVYIDEKRRPVQETIKKHEIDERLARTQCLCRDCIMRGIIILFVIRIIFAIVETSFPTRAILHRCYNIRANMSEVHHFCNVL